LTLCHLDADAAAAAHTLPLLANNLAAFRVADLDDASIAAPAGGSAPKAAKASDGSHITKSSNKDKGKGKAKEIVEEEYELMGHP
jgi:hypothetical protein